MRTPLRLLPSLATFALAAGAAFVSVSAQAALVARNLDGDTSTAEAYYDSALGITWMRDVQRLASTYGLTVAMTQASAQTALASFNADASVNHGFSGWRLPEANGVHVIGGLGCQTGFNGSTDCGSNVNVASSELAHLFHATLGNISSRDTAGGFLPGTAGVDFGLVHSGDFTGLAADRYWTGEASYRLIFGMPQHGHVVFNFADGSQGLGAATSVARAWLVHDGDIGGAVSSSAVPVPGSLGLAALGLALLARRRTA